MLKGGDAIQRGTERLERQVHKNLLKFNKVNYNVLDKGWGNPRHKYRMGREWIESSPVDKVLGVLVDKKLNMTHQHVPAALKAKGALGCPKKCGQQGKGRDSIPLLHSGEIPPAVLHPGWWPPA